MSVLDILLLAGIAAGVVVAVRVCRRKPGCGGDCANCGGCEKQK